MKDQIQITLTQKDTNGKLIPVENLIKDNFKFYDFTGGVTGTEIDYLTFYDRGGGSYIFGDFTLTAITPALLHLDGTPILSLGILYLGAPELSFLKKGDDTLQGILNAGGNRITGLPAQDANTNPTDAASVGLILGDNSYVGKHYFKKSGDNLEGNMNAAGNKILNLPAPASDTEPLRKQDLLTFGIASFLPSAANVIIVSPTLAADCPNLAYKKIQDAINAAHTNASASYQFTILIYPHTAAAGYSENITLQPYVHLQGIGKPVITGTLSGCSANSTIRGINITYSGNLSITNAKLYDSTLRILNDDTGYSLTVTSCILSGCSLLNVGQVEFNPTITSGGGNIFLNCCSNISCTTLPTDKGSITSIESITSDFS